MATNVQIIEGKRSARLPDGTLFGLFGNRLGFYNEKDESFSVGSVDKDSSPEIIVSLLRTVMKMTDSDATGIILNVDRD